MWPCICTCAFHPSFLPCRRLFYPQVKEGVVLDDPRLADASLNPWRLNVSTVCQTPDPLTRSPPIFIT